MIGARERRPLPSHTDDRRVRDAGRVRAPNRETSTLLPLVMNEICALMQARGAMLTLHSSDGGPPNALFTDKRLADAAHETMLNSLTHGIRAEFSEDQCFWRDLPRHGSMLVMPVEQMAGHGRLVISLLFDRADAAERDAAERLYRERKPFAVGFFQLWQHNRVLQQRAQSLELVLDHTAIGLVMIDRNSHIVFANHMANEILSAADGIGRSNGMLRAVNLADGVNLQAAISHAIAGDDAASTRGQVKVPLLAFARRKGPPLVAAFLPAASPGVEEGDVAAIMYLVDPQIDTGKMLSPLCRLYGLSPVETALVCHVAAGETIASAAQQMHVKEPTARSYLKSIFIKTGTRRQTELVVLMLSSLIRMKRDVLQEALSASGSERALGMRA